ncbi:MAG: zinc dependent phospholipase C family protein [Candidatus Lernaella stagnicola]|nr:zinc dependent phospholipase C family protein [Candidatus Lernaella stagnicola]
MHIFSPRSWTAAILIVTAFAAITQAAGMSVHCEVSTRAAHYFDFDQYPAYRDIVQAHPEAYQAGSPFPDWGYAFGYHDPSEDAHWPPFLITFAEYIHDTYPKPWDEDTKKLVAFLAGVISHANADLDWHGLGGVDEGTIDVMSEQEFHGDWNAAHGIADTGGEFIDRYERDMDWLELRWYFPFADIVAVYERYGYEPGYITEEVLRPRTFMLFLGALANRLGGWLLYPDYARQSPFLVEELNDYFIGGLDGMAIRVMWQWWDYFTIIEEGGSDALSPAVAWGEVERHENPLLPPLEQLLFVANLADIEIERGERGVTYIARLPRPLVRNDQIDKPDIEPVTPAVSWFADEPYRYVGHRFARGDFNGDGTADLALGGHGYGEPGLPQLGEVYVFFGGAPLLGEVSIEEADLVLQGGESHGRFGWQLAVVDLNRDGVADLAVSTPTTQADATEYRGEVSVFFGGGDFGGEPDIIVAAAETYANLGHSLAGGDLNGDGFADLIVGSPYARSSGSQNGLALVFFSGLAAGTYSPADADWLVFGEQPYDWFGYALGHYETPTGRRMLVVGAPGCDTDDRQATGTLYAYDFTGAIPTEAFLELSGRDEFDKVGSAFTFGAYYGDGEPWLAVAAPTRSDGSLTHTGAVYLLQLSWLAGAQSIDDFAGAQILFGEANWSRLGRRLVTGDANADGTDDLLIVQPWHGTWTKRMVGTAYLYLGGPGFLGDHTLADATWTIPGQTHQAMLGDAAHMWDVDGDGHDDVLLGAPRDSRHARHGGTANIYLAPVPRPAVLTPAVASPGDEGRFTLTGAGFFNGELTLTLGGGDVLKPRNVQIENVETVSFDLRIPARAPLGAYELTMENVFGQGLLPDALTLVDDPPADDDDDDDDDDNDDHDDDDDDDNDDDTVDYTIHGGDENNKEDGCGF